MKQLLSSKQIGSEQSELTQCNPYSNIAFILLFIGTFFSVSLSAENLNGTENNLTPHIPFNSVKTGSLYLKATGGYFSSIQQNSDYHVQVNGLLARVTFSQSFTNSSEEFLEGVYVFPLIDDAAVDSMIMEIGERRIVGKIKEKIEAEKIYQKAKNQGKKASLVSQQRPNMFTSQLSNIAPGETIKITISYLQSVKYSEEEFSLRIPLTITPRYIPNVLNFKLKNGHDDTKSKHEDMQQTRVISNSGWENISPPQTYISDGQKVDISMVLKTGLPITNIVSHHHQIKKHRRNNSIELTLADENVLLNKDFVISWHVAQGQSPKVAFFQSSDENYHYGLLMIMPPSIHQGQAIKKEVTYILDTSGSMAGVAIEQAKQALITALDLLHYEDSFNIIAFNSSTVSLFSSAKLANQANIIKAKYWINQQSAGGGTNMYPAIAQALASNKQHHGDEDKYRQVIFITDGSVGNEQELFNLIGNRLGKTRLHTIGIGSAPNTFFMSRAAEFGRGTYRYIGSINEVNNQMHKLFSDISKPMMKSIALHWPNEAIEYYPRLIPDLYQNKPLVVSARWPKSSNSHTSKKIQITGQLAGQNWQENIASKAESGNKKNLGIDQWWARQKIKHLSQEHQRSDANEKLSLKAQITELALKHHLISSYTSFVAVEERISRDENSKLSSKKIANLMPKGSMQSIPLANTSLGLLTYLYLGIALLLLSSLLRLFKSKLCRIMLVKGR